MPYRLAQGRSIYEFYIGIIKIGSLNGYLYKKPEKVRVRKYNTYSSKNVLKLNNTTVVINNKSLYIIFIHHGSAPVSYTHLDVYKRQLPSFILWTCPSHLILLHPVIPLLYWSTDSSHKILTSHPIILFFFLLVVLHCFIVRHYFRSKKLFRRI